MYLPFQGITTGAVRFRFDGNPINDEDTPSLVSTVVVFSSSFLGGLNLHEKK